MTHLQLEWRYLHHPRAQSGALDGYLAFKSLIILVISNSSLA